MSTDAMTSTESSTRRCQRPGCNRKLTSARSRAAGFGPVCVRKMAAALAGLSDTQVDKALGIVEAGGVHPTTREGVWGVESSDFTDEYRTTEDGLCSCRHGVAIMTVDDQPCIHVGALRVARIALRNSLMKVA